MFLQLVKSRSPSVNKFHVVESLSDDDHNFIGWYGGQIEYLTFNLRESLQSLLSGEVSLVADVFTDNLNNRYLHEAVGKVREMDVIVEIEGRKQINKGGVFTYYEFPVEGKRLNDEEWRALLKEGKAPKLPVWTESFIVEK